MSERINPRPEVGITLQEFARLVELFEATQDDPELSQLIATAIIGTLSKIDLDDEELVLVQPKALTPIQRPAPRERVRPTSPQTQDDTERITRGATGFYLCSASEGRLLRSLEDTGIVLVNGFLLAKIVGKISVLALETKEGFQAGHWYAPRTQWMRDSIRQAFDQGLTGVTLYDDLWDYMRKAEVNNLTTGTVQLSNSSILSTIDSEQALLDYCRKVVAQLPAKLGNTIQGIQRTEYRQRHKEGV